MVSEVFASGDSFLHRYDPRDKIIVAVLFSIVVALADRPAVLALAESFHSGWRAYVNGRSRGTLRVNIAFLGVSLGEGRHTVDFVYPLKWYYYVGMLLTLFGVLSLVMMYIRKEKPICGVPDNGKK